MSATCAATCLLRSAACTCKSPRRTVPSRRAVPGAVAALRSAATFQQQRQRRSGEVIAVHAAREDTQSAQPGEQPPLQQQQQSGYGEGGLLLRLLVISFTGAATVKYGELLLGEIPFSHNLGLALTMVFAPCIAYSVVLAARSKST